MSNANETWSDLLGRADRAAAWSRVLRYALREVPGSRWQTIEIMGSSRAPSWGELERLTERAEEDRNGCQNPK